MMNPWRTVEVVLAVAAVAAGCGGGNSDGDRARPPPAPAPMPAERRVVTMGAIKADVRLPTAWSRLSPEAGGFQIAGDARAKPDEWLVLREIRGVGSSPAELARLHGQLDKGELLLLPPGEAAPGRQAVARAYHDTLPCQEVQVWWSSGGTPFHCIAESCSGRWREYLGFCLDAQVELAPVEPAPPSPSPPAGP